VTVGADGPALQHVLHDPAMPLAAAVHGTNTAAVDLVPATIDLAAMEPALAAARESRALSRRRDGLAGYDFALLDCPPSLGHLTLNALVAADGLLIVVDCGGHAIRGVANLLAVVNQLRRDHRAELAVMGVLVNEFDRRTTVSSDMLEAIREYFGASTFETVIPRRTDIERANNAGMPIISYAPRSDAAEAYRSLAQEVLARG